METEHKQKNMKDSLLAKIRGNELTMRPRFYFTVKMVALAFVALLTLIVSVLLFNFILFSVLSSGRGLLLAFGPRGYISFLQFFPWPLLGVDILLILLLQWMLRRFRFGYKSPALYLVFMLLVLAISFGVLIDQETGFNDQLQNQARGGHLPGFFGDFVMHSRRPPEPGDGVCRCTIISISGSTITAIDMGFGSTTVFTIQLPDNNNLATTSGLKVGDTVFIVGDTDGDHVIHAFGVRKIGDNDYLRENSRERGE